jgi:Uma2 family endonuclease
MNWQEVCGNKNLYDLPFKIELNKWGQIVMSPAKVIHSFYQSRIQTLLEKLLTGGIAMQECAIQTSDGVKVADVVWVSSARVSIILQEVAASIAPEICVEVKSASNTLEEMLLKKKLYLNAGALEVWLCDKAGKLRFYNKQGQIEHSIHVPNFPKQIKPTLDN